MNAAVLDRPVLALNRRWLPVRTTRAADAIALVAKGSAVILDPETFQEHTLHTWADVSAAKAFFAGSVIRSPSLVLAVPEVIRLTRYEKLGERSVVFSRRNLFRRDRATCQYCGVQPGPAELTIDHVVPRSRGGLSSWTNCVLACVRCNTRKADRSPTQVRMALRRPPRKPSWTGPLLAPAGERPLSWDQFLSKAYWETELEA